jgi:hypothetical protein
VIVESDLAGFSHRELALLSAVVRTASDGASHVSAYRPLLAREDRVPVARAAAVVALADAVQHRLPRSTEPAVSCSRHGRSLVLHVPVFDPWLREALAERLRHAFGGRIVLDAAEPAGGGA